MAIVHLPRPLREKLGEEAGEALEMRDGCEALAQSLESLREEMRQGHRSLAQNIEALRGEIRAGHVVPAQRFGAPRQQIRHGELTLPEKIDPLRMEMPALTADLIRWLFVLSVTQVLLLGGLMVVLW